MILPASDINQKLDLLAMQENEVSLLKSVLCSANIISASSSYNSLDLSENNIDFYLFGSDKEEIINKKDDYKMHDYLLKNPIIKAMFDYFRKLPKSTFP